MEQILTCGEIYNIFTLLAWTGLEILFLIKLYFFLVGTISNCLALLSWNLVRIQNNFLINSFYVIIVHQNTTLLNSFQGGTCTCRSDVIGTAVKKS